MPVQVREREDKFDVDDSWTMPDLGRALPPGLSVDSALLHLSSLYFDTSDLALLDNQITLRKRSGDVDAGWQLKVPDGAARTEIRLPSTPGSAVPRDLSDLLLGVRGGERLTPVAKIDTRREVARVVDSGGVILAEIADDRVVASTLGATTTLSQWREVEVELVAGDEGLLEHLGQILTDAGATASSHSSKVAHVLMPTPPTDTGKRRRSELKSVRDVVGLYLREQYAALVAGDLALRRNKDVIHPTRVATRRYRSVLRGFHDVFEPERAAALDAELAWYANELGEVRDREVLRAHLDTAVHELPPQLVLGPVAADVDSHLLAEQLKAREQLTRTMRGVRYRALMKELRSWAVQPPVTPRGKRPAARVERYLQNAEQLLAKRLRGASDPAAPDELLHRTRKAGKRLRYIAELAAPVLGRPARRAAKHATAVQDILGRHQDSIIASELLLRMGAATSTSPGENGFTYGLLYAHEQRRISTSREDARHRLANSR